MRTYLVDQHLPSERLDPRALTLWRTDAALNLAIALVIAFAVTAVLIWQDVAWYWAVLPVAFVLAAGVPVAVVVPGLTWRHWRYQVRELEVDLQHGWWTTTRTLIPMTRIQHVDTRRRPLERRFGLATVVLYTAAGSSEIPALAVEVAGDVRDRIAALANVQEEL